MQLCYFHWLPYHRHTMWQSAHNCGSTDCSSFRQHMQELSVWFLTEAYFFLKVYRLLWPLVTLMSWKKICHTCIGKCKKYISLQHCWMCGDENKLLIPFHVVFQCFPQYASFSPISLWFVVVDYFTITNIHSIVQGDRCEAENIPSLKLEIVVCHTGSMLWNGEKLKRHRSPCEA